MTLLEALDYFRKYLLTVARAAKQARHWKLEKAVASYERDMEALKIAVSAIEEKAERENPAPLTPEELAHMRGEPVWIVWPECQMAARWWIVGGYDWAVMEFDDYTTMKTYGKTWVAYRHKPKEER